MQTISKAILGIALCASTGCRAPWAPVPNAEPSFGALIDAERASGGFGAGSSERFSSEDDLSYAEPPSGRQQRRPTRQDGTQAKGTDVEIDLAAATEELGPEHAALVKRQMEALRRRLVEGPDQTSVAAADQQDESEPVTFSFSDSEDDAQPVVVSKQAPPKSDRSASQVTLASMEQVRRPDGQIPPGVSPVITASHESRQNPSDDVPLTRELENKMHPESRSSMRDAMSWQDLAHEAIQQMDAAIEETTSPEQKVELEKSRRLLSLAVGDLQSATVAVPGLEPNLQQYLQHSLTSWHDVTDPAGHPHTRKRSTLALRSQRKAMQYLAAASDLSVANAAFCTDVKSFGDIKEFENYRFQPGQEVLLYCEVDNFVSAPMPNGTNHETHLRGSYKITDTSGYPVDEQALPANQDVSQTPRRDYFMVYRIWLPQTIAAGKYELNLAIEDINGRKFGNQVIDFEIAQ